MSQSANLAEALTLAEVMSRSDEKTFARGKAYFHGGKVSRLEEKDGGVRAIVRGTEPYNVELTTRYGGLTCYCDCPVSRTATFCKHAVAVALSWLENSGTEVFQPDEEPQPKKPRKKRKTYAEQVHEYVASLDADALRTWLMEAVERDVALRDKLLLAARSANASDLPGMKSAIRQATRVRRAMHDWREVAEYADGLFSLCDVLRARLNGPNAADVVELAELAIDETETSLERMDDSNGYVLPAINELAAIHLEACERTRPDPEKLAERLFRFQMEGQWGTFRDVFPAYADALGDVGLRIYRELLNEQWSERPAPATSDSAYAFDSRRSKVTHAMAALAEFDGDIDALIRIKSEDLSNPYQFLKVAQLCQEHGRQDEGLAWAERGIEESKKNPDSSLLTFCIDGYLSRGDFDKADAYAWRRFVSHTGALAFQALLKVAAATGKHDETRQRALEHIWDCIRKEEAGKAKRSVWNPTTRTELVKLYLAEHDNEAAWNAFTGGPVATQIVQQMAAVRAATHPRDALVVYHNLLPDAVARGTGKAQYRDAFEIVQAIGAVRAKLSEHAQFAAELAEMRQTYRAKRNFIVLLNTLC
ncbi:SWIM zinc finger family protein [Paraburkholderia terrae]|uniref:SWIM-type domain-containing protein n=1 Tax=Paraburkholderia terrae TaxID=311230 RepID=A0ABM7U2L0_9BURK|nr:DUF6880 family protein [Paraburkholderia terrae]BCZ80984.1 hypothetical protein PTKU64_46590 [Paraburkholderia terrae]BDC40549.1 hypothetical protein PTKU15_38460 [Paraburkholderia terrae]